MKNESMQKEWKIKYYKNDEGECPIEDFIKTLSEKEQEKIKVYLEYLKQEGINIRRPQADYLRDGIYELRIKLKEKNLRTLYFFCFENYIVLTHAFFKKTKRVPTNEINRALIYKQDFLNKYNINNIEEI